MALVSPLPPHSPSVMLPPPALDAATVPSVLRQMASYLLQAADGSEREAANAKAIVSNAVQEVNTLRVELAEAKVISSSAIEEIDHLKTDLADARSKAAEASKQFESLQEKLVSKSREHKSAQHVLSVELESERQRHHQIAKELAKVRESCSVGSPGWAKPGLHSNLTQSLRSPRQEPNALRRENSATSETEDSDAARLRKQVQQLGELSRKQAEKIKEHEERLKFCARQAKPKTDVYTDTLAVARKRRRSLGEISVLSDMLGLGGPERKPEKDCQHDQGAESRASQKPNKPLDILTQPARDVTPATEDVQQQFVQLPAASADMLTQPSVTGSAAPIDGMQLVPLPASSEDMPTQPSPRAFDRNDPPTRNSQENVQNQVPIPDPVVRGVPSSRISPRRCSQALSGLDVPGLRVFQRQRNRNTEESQVPLGQPDPYGNADESQRLGGVVVAFERVAPALEPPRQVVRAQGRHEGEMPPPPPGTVPSRSTVRKRDEREALPAFDCEQCREFYQATGRMPSSCAEAKAVSTGKLKSSRHRYEHAPACTPPGFWDLSFPRGQSLSLV